MTDYRKLLVLRMWAIYGMEHEISIQFEDHCTNFPNRDVYDRALTSIVECHEIENHIKNS